MTEIKASIEYALTIDPKGENHKLQVDSTFESGIVALLMTEQILAIQTQMWKNQKEGNGPGKKELTRIIRKLNGSTETIRIIVNNMLKTYDEFKEYELSVREQQRKERGELPKTFSDLNDSDNN